LVSAGSVGIAGAQTGIYPKDAPGGWQIIGRTPLTIFDPVQLALFAPGDTVSFYPINLDEYNSLKKKLTMQFKIIKKGIADSWQDAGNYGQQHLGIQVGGYMDFLSAQLANKILGNKLDQKVFEIHFPASIIEFEEDVFIAITGANFIPVINEKVFLCMNASK